MTSAAHPRAVWSRLLSPTSWPSSSSASSAGIWRRSHGTCGNDAAQSDLDGGGLARRFSDLLPDPVDGAGKLQDRARSLCGAAVVPVLPLDDRELRHRAGAQRLLPPRL